MNVCGSYMWIHGILLVCILYIQSVICTECIYVHVNNSTKLSDVLLVSKHVLCWFGR